MPIPTLSEPLRARSRLQDDVFGGLLTAIVTGQLKPGERLRDEELMAWTGASRTPVREALGRLTLMGLVEVERQRATRVSRLDPVYLRQVMTVIGLLLAEAVRQAVPLLDPADVQELKRVRRDVLGSNSAVRDAVLDGGIKRELYDLFLRVYGNTVTMRLVAARAPHIRRLFTLHGERLDIASSAVILQGVTDAALSSEAEAAAEGITAFFEGPVAELLDTLPAAEGV